MGKKIVGLLLSCLVLVIVVSSFPQPAEAAFEQVPLESDSTIIELHIREIVVGNAIEEFSEHSFNSHLDRAQLDSILWAEQSMRIVGAQMTWSPDSAFRICTVQTESCGGYCNSQWISWLHFNDGSGLVINDAPFDDILSIECMPDGKYLIFETSNGRDGMVACRTDAVCLILLDGYQIKEFGFPDPFGEKEYNSSIFYVQTCTYTMTDCSLQYDTKKQELLFHYSDDVSPWSIPDSVSVYDGAFYYNDTAFIVRKMTEHRIKYIEREERE